MTEFSGQLPVKHMEGGGSEQAVRRSQRMVMRVPLLVGPAYAPAPSEWESVETVVISLHGGMIRTRQRFPVGTTLDIRMRDTQRSTRGRVVWTGVGANERTLDVGFEFLEPPGFWEVRFQAGQLREGLRSSPPARLGVV